MAVSALNLYNRSYHKIPRHVTVFLKLTAKADVQADGYTINYGNDLVASAVRNGEGILDVTTKFPWKDMVGVSICTSTNLCHANFTSATASTGVVKFTFEAFADGTTDKDPDAAVIFIRMDFNTCGSVGAK
jgi:hypothetical protein